MGSFRTRCLGPSKLLLSITLSVLALGLGSTACSRSSSPEAPTVRVGAPLVDFKPEETLELTLAKFDPRTQDVWTARLTRADARAEWQVASAPQGQTLLDRRADSTFINHLLSLIKTLSVHEMAPEGTLTSLGLDQPLFSIRWGTPGQPLKELRLGDANPKGLGNYCVLVSPQGNSEPVIVRGAALQMLGMIEKFEVLRRRRLLTFEADDVDELELWRGKAKTLAVERLGDDWTELHRKKRVLTVGQKLEALTHLRIQNFLDDPSQVTRLRQKLENAPTHRAIFKDRDGKPTELQLRADSGHTWARISSRPEAVFEVYPEALRPFLKP